MVPLFGAAYAAPNKGPTILYWFRFQKTVFNPPVHGKIQGLFKAFECFSSSFQGKLIFKDFSRQSCIFKYFSSLCKPWTVWQTSHQQTHHHQTNPPWAQRIIHLEQNQISP